MKTTDRERAARQRRVDREVAEAVRAAMHRGEDVDVEKLTAGEFTELMKLRVVIQ